MRLPWVLPERAVEVLGKGLVLPGGEVLQGLVLVDDGLDAAGDLPVEAFQLLVQVREPLLLPSDAAFDQQHEHERRQRDDALLVPAVPVADQVEGEPQLRAELAADGEGVADLHGPGPGADVFGKRKVPGELPDLDPQAVGEHPHRVLPRGPALPRLDPGDLPFRDPVAPARPGELRAAQMPAFPDGSEAFGDFRHASLSMDDDIGW